MRFMSFRKMKIRPYVFFLILIILTILIGCRYNDSRELALEKEEEVGLAQSQDRVKGKGLESRDKASEGEISKKQEDQPTPEDKPILESGQEKGSDSGEDSKPAKASDSGVPNQKKSESTLGKGSSSENKKDKAEETEQRKSTDNTNKTGQTDQTDKTDKLDKTDKPDKTKYLVCIDPGHQSHRNPKLEPTGPGAKEMKASVSSGTRGLTTGVYEYEFNLDLSKKLEKALKNLRIDVVMTRNSHDVDISNSERAQIGNRIGADLAIRIHADGSNDPKLRGYTVLHPAKDCPYTKPIYEKSLKAATIVNKYMETGKIKNRGLRPRKDLTGFNFSQIPVILVEAGFMTNAEDEKLLLDASYQEELAQNIAKGISAYLTSIK